MRKFKDYTELCRQIHVPENLKEHVINSSGKIVNVRGTVHRKIITKAVLAAILLLAFLATACTLAVSSGLINRLTRRGLADADTLESLSTTRSDSSDTDFPQVTGYLAVAKDDSAEYRVLEAICDYNSIYIHFQIVPLDTGTMFIHQALSPDSPARELGIPGINNGTVEEYAQEQGKNLRYANISLPQDSMPISSFGVDAETAKDGSLHIYGNCENFSDEEEFSLTCTAYTYPVDRQTVIPEEDRTELNVTLQNKSSLSSLVFTRFDPEIQEKYGIVIENLVIEETELGYYCIFTYRGEKAERTLFSMVDENGQYFSSGGPQGSSSNSLNSDGSYSLTCGVPTVEHPEKMMFMLVDENFDKHGPYSLGQ